MLWEGNSNLLTALPPDQTGTAAALPANLWTLLGMFNPRLAVVLSKQQTEYIVRGS
jgi:hypothetical protein